MFSKFRRVLVLLLTSSAVFFCIICMKDSFWHRVRPTVYLANQSTIRNNDYIIGGNSGSKSVSAGKRALLLFIIL